MIQPCLSCNAELDTAQATSSVIAQGICRSCQRGLSASNDLLDAIDAPVLLMQPDPRQVLTANKKARELFGKGLWQIKGHRGGQVFDCLNSFTEAGCGKDPGCENCKIKDAIVDTFVSGTPRAGVSTQLEIKKPDGIVTYAVQVSTEMTGDLALVRIDRYERA